jgi:hypothetical protein
VAAYLICVGYEAGPAFIRHFPERSCPACSRRRGTPRPLPPYRSSRPVLLVRLPMQGQPEFTARETAEPVVRPGRSRDPAAHRHRAGPSQLLHIVSGTREGDRVTVRVIPFSKGAPVLSGPFTLLEPTAACRTSCIPAPAGRLQHGHRRRPGWDYADTPEKLLETALPAEDCSSSSAPQPGNVLSRFPIVLARLAAPCGHCLPAAAPGRHAGPSHPGWMGLSHVT